MTTGIKQKNKERLHKLLAETGVASRREVERWIAAGRICVNGVVAKLGVQIDPSVDRITIDGRLQRISASTAERQVLIYNKPEGEICTRSDPEGRRTVFDNLPKLPKGRWISVGRLDINTTGLLLFTNDGELAKRLMHPSYQVDREYAVRVFGVVTDEHLENMLKGVKVDGYFMRFTDIQPAGGDGLNSWYHVCLQEGRNRAVRRLWESQNLQVNRLKRVRFANVFLPKQLRKGKSMSLDAEMINQLSDLVGLKSLSGSHLARKLKLHNSKINNPKDKDRRSKNLSFKS